MKPYMRLILLNSAMTWAGPVTPTFRFAHSKAELRVSLASHTLYHCEKEGLVTLRTTSCVQRQKSGATNHLRDSERMVVCAGWMADP